MIKTLKWIYDLGVKHERLRIELAIREYRREDDSSYLYVKDSDEAKQREDFNREVELTIKNLIRPVCTELVEKSLLDD